MVEAAGGAEIRPSIAVGGEVGGAKGSIGGCHDGRGGWDAVAGGGGNDGRGGRDAEVETRGTGVGVWPGVEEHATRVRGGSAESRCWQ